MPDSIDLNSLTLIRIDEVDPKLYKDFCCDRPELNEFLVEDAMYFHEQNLTNTTIVKLDDKMVGFFSLSSDAIRLSTSEKGDLALNDEYQINYFPAVKITKLAVATEFAGKGIGRYLINMIEGLIYDLPLAVRFLTVDAIAIKVDFYEKNKFVASLFREKQLRSALKGEESQNVLMHKDIYVD